MGDQEDRELVGRFLDSVKDYGAREISRIMEGVTHDDVSRWRRDDWKRLSAAKRRVLIAFMEKGGRLSEGSASVDSMNTHEETPEQAVALDYPDVSTLTEGAQDFYFRVVGEWTSTRRWPEPYIAEAAWDLTEYVRDSSHLAESGTLGSGLSEEDQVKALTTVRKTVERIYDRRVRESKR